MEGGGGNEGRNEREDREPAQHDHCEEMLQTGPY